MCYKKISRRKFLGQASCAALGSTTMLSSLANLMLFNGMAADKANSDNPDDYKALVCILLAGGNDSFNMLVPYGDPEYNAYAQSRSNLALSKANNQITPITLNTPDPTGKTFGVHYNMQRVIDLYNAGNLAFIPNVGTLVEPVANVTEYNNNMTQLPLGLFSHSDQIEQWQTSVPLSREAIGWGGKMADILKSCNSNQNFSMNISLGGKNVFQTGNTISEFSISNQENGLAGIEQYRPWLGNSGFIHELREDAIENMSAQVYNDILKDALGDLNNQAFASIEEFAGEMEAIPPFTTNFSDHSLSQDLKMMARTIAAQEGLGMNRQTFFTVFGGWDHHDEVLNNQEYMLMVLSNAIGEFYEALDEISPDMKDKVTLFTISDFARTLTSNGNGSDHAWGGNSIVAGGAVNGTDFYGTYPDLHIPGNPLMTDERGRLIPTTSTDAYFAELALWFGLSPTDLIDVLPNIGNFYNINSNQMPLGFLPWV